MLDIDFMVQHTGFFVESFMDIIAFLLLLGVVVFYFVRRHQMKEKQKDLEDEISEVYETYDEGDGEARGSF